MSDNGFVAALAILKRRIAEETQDIARGRADDWPDYQRRVGRRAAMSEAFDEIHDMYRTLNLGDIDEYDDEIERL